MESRRHTERRVGGFSFSTTMEVKNQSISHLIIHPRKLISHPTHILKNPLIFHEYPAKILELFQPL